MLSAEHTAMLAASRLSPEVIAARGYKTVTDESELRALGFKPAQCRVPGLLIPIYTPDGGNGLYRLRPDNPRVKVEQERDHKGRKKNHVIKYEQPKGNGLRLDCNPLARQWLGQPNVPVWFVEGEKKADALVSLGQCAIALPGVYGFKARNEFGGTAFSADFDYIALKNRRVYIGFDSDSITNPDVNRAESILREHLTRKGAAVLVLRIPPAPDGAKQGVDDYLASGHDLDDLTELVEEHPTIISQSFKKLRDDSLPSIATNDRYLRDVTADAVKALEERNFNLHLFVRSGALARVVRDERGAPTIQPITEDALRLQMDCTANYHRIVVTQKETKAALEHPPLAVAKTIMALGAWPFPALEAVVECPTMRADGSILDKPGYDAETRLFYYPADNLRGVEIPEQPTREDARAAVEFLQKPLADFPFSDDASRANALAALLTPILRPAIDGNVPLALVDAPQAGTGKSLLSAVISIIATGHAPAIITAPRDDAEWTKSITSTLQDGAPVLVIDNLTGKLYSGILAAALTSHIWTARLLGTNTIIKLPNRGTWIANGNNVMLAGDLPRRCYWVRMDAKNSRPWMRSGFAIANLPEWVLCNRGALITAALTLARAWWVAGRPMPKITPLGGFEEWTRLLAGVLAFGGVTGFLENLSQMYEQSDVEGPQWERWILALKEKFGAQAVTVSAICSALVEDKELVEVVPEMFDAPITDTGAVKPVFKQKLGMQFGARKGTRYGNSQARIEQGKATGNRASTWRFFSDDCSEASEASEAVSHPTDLQKNSNPTFFPTAFELDSASEASVAPHLYTGSLEQGTL